MGGLRAVLFDQDGVIIDTERDGHRVAFNQAFRELGFDVTWDVETYHGLLAVAGGKERMTHYLRSRGFGKTVPPEQEEAIIRHLHERKTAIFVKLIESGSLPPRPGIVRFVDEAVRAGLAIGICTTSNERAAKAVAEHLFPQRRFDVLLAGDIVTRKKPDPEIYRLALERLGLAPAQCLVVEDSENGIVAAKAAGMRVLATSNPYTVTEDLSAADVIVTCLGDPDGERAVLRKPSDLPGFDGVLHLDIVARYLGGLP